MKEPDADAVHLDLWTQVSEQTLARYALFELQRVARRSPTTGSEHSFLRLVAPDWVNVVAITEDRRLILVEQYRHGINRVTVEIPGGAVDEGEGPAAAAVRELEEETGYRADDLVLIGVVHPNPAFLTNSCWTFLALDCRPTGAIRPDTSEEITVRLVEPDDFTRLIDGPAGDLGGDAVGAVPVLLDQDQPAVGGDGDDVDPVRGDQAQERVLALVGRRAASDQLQLEQGVGGDGLRADLRPRLRAGRVTIWLFHGPNRSAAG